MKCLKADEYIKRTVSAQETDLLRVELEVGGAVGSHVPP